MTTKRKPALMLTALLAFALCLMLAVCVLTACNDGGSTRQGLPGGDQAKSETPDEEDSGAEDTDAPSDTPQGDAGEPNDEESQEPDDEEKNPTDEEPATPEMTSAEYFEINLQLLKSVLKEEYEEDYKGDTFNLDNAVKMIINEGGGEIYCFANTIGKYGDVRGIRFFVASFDNNILKKSQKELYACLSSSVKNYDLSFASYARLKPNLSEEMYKEFEQFLCSQSYDNDGETVTFGVGARVLDISRYIADYDAYGNRYIQFLVVDGDKNYTARLENAMPPGYDDWAIGQIMGYSNNVFKVTEVKDFKEFNYEDDEEQM